MTFKEMRMATKDESGKPWSQQRFAAYFGLSIRTYEKWERGERTPPDGLPGIMERLLYAEGILTKEKTTV